MKIHDHIWQTIGRTPLVRVKRLCAEYQVKADILLKLEFFNPLSSVKDRLALALIEDGEKRGLITPTTTLIEPTSGNTGIGLAFICAAKGYRLILTMPESMSYERRKMLRLFGAEIVLTPADQGMKGAIARAEELATEIKNAYIPRQFENPANVEIHRTTTAQEIWQDTEGKVDALLAGVGTGGTITGISMELKSRKPSVKTFAVEPAGSPVISGGEAGTHKIQGIGAGFVPKILDKSLIDEIVTVSDEEAIAMTHHCARQEGIPIGLSSGAALHAALTIGQRDELQDKVIVVIIPSMAERYLSLPAFRDLETG